MNWPELWEPWMGYFAVTAAGMDDLYLHQVVWLYQTQSRRDEG